MIASLNVCLNVNHITFTKNSYLRVQTMYVFQYESCCSGSRPVGTITILDPLDPNPLIVLLDLDPPFIQNPYPIVIISAVIFSMV
jgi:hypothetical protein